MEENYNSVGLYENLESLGEEVANRGVADVQDSKMAEILNSMNQVLHMMVDSQRVQEQMLAAVIKNGEKLEEILSEIRKLPPANGDDRIEQGFVISQGPQRNTAKVCYRCGKAGHIKRNCRTKYSIGANGK